MNKNSSIVGSFAKGLAVLECFSAKRPSLTIAQVSALTGFDRATSRRLLLTLVHAGYGEHDGKCFALTPKALRLGMDAMASLPLPQLVQPWLDQLTEKIGQSCSVSVLDDTEIVYLARAAQRRVMSIGLMPGSRLPAHSTSMGRVLLAQLDDQAVIDILDRSDLTPGTPYSITEPGLIISELERIRRQGYALNDQEIEIGLCSIAVPVANKDDVVVAALNIGMAATQDRLDLMTEDYLPALLSVQAGLKRVL